MDALNYKVEHEPRSKDGRLREERGKGKEEDRASGVPVWLDCCEDTQGSESIPKRRVFIPLLALQQESCYISWLQRTVNWGEKKNVGSCEHDGVKNG